MTLGHHLRRIHQSMAQHGLNPLGLLHVRHLSGFWSDIKAYREAAGSGHPFPFVWSNLFTYPQR